MNGRPLPSLYVITFSFLLIEFWDTSCLLHDYLQFGEQERFRYQYHFAVH
jgi:hypothetical protein